MNKLSNTVRGTARKEAAALAAKADREIDLSDLPATTANTWKNAPCGQFYRPIKKQLTVRIDADVLAWLKAEGKGYQSRLNDILRTAMVAKPRQR